MRGVNPSSYTVFLALIALVVTAGSIVVYRLRRDVEEDASPVTDDELLRDFERAYYSGEMDEAEFRRVSETLGARKAGVPRPAPQPSTPPEPQAEADAGAGHAPPQDSGA